MAVVNAVDNDVNSVDDDGRTTTIDAMSPVDVDGARFAWRENGTGDETVLLLHGLGGSRLSWEPQLDEIGERCRVVAWDLPGYGASPARGPLTFALLADAVVELIDELGVSAVHLVGISFGGMIAQYTAARHPLRVVTLTLLATSPMFGLDGTSPDHWRAARLAPLDAGFEPADFADGVLAALAGPSITPSAMAGQRVAMGRITGAALRRTIDCLLTHDSRSVLPSIVAPTRCLVGELDDETPADYARAVADLIPGASMQVVPDAGHLLNVEAAGAVNAAILDQMRCRPGATASSQASPEREDHV